MLEFLDWSDDIKMRLIKEESELVIGISNISSRMYLTHIPIIPLKVSVAVYFNKWHTEQKASCKGIFNDVYIDRLAWIHAK